MSYLIAFAGFAALIMLHESGHFVAAKATGMRVERFALFFPPLVLKRRIGETEYGIGAVPLGGFVKITGMNPDEELPPEVAQRAYYHQPVWKRIVVIAAGPVMNVLVALILLFGLSFEAREATNKVAEVASNAPATDVLRPGDAVVAVDGVRGGPNRLANQINRHRCPEKLTPRCKAATPALLQVRRDDRTTTFPIRPAYDAGCDAQRMRVGFQYGTRPVNVSAGQAASRSVDSLWYITTATLGSVAHLFTKNKCKQISSVVGGYKYTQKAAKTGARQALLVLAVISLSLAIINLFPFLPLDGGHIFWSLVEKLRGRAVPFRVIEQASVIGFVLVIFLFVIGLSNDIGRLTHGGFNSP